MEYIDINELINITNQAARLVMLIYGESSHDVTRKDDFSVLTKADIESHTYICNSLKKKYPNIPVISEESVDNIEYEARKDWDCFFLVDPLDGTKEFIKRNGEFTINIALIENNKPVVGVINAPALGLVYYAVKGKGAYKILNDKHIKLEPSNKDLKKLKAVVSRSHGCEKTQNFLDGLRDKGAEVSVITSGSALKFGLIAEGAADIYPRFAPTMEWDIAAGDIIVSEVGMSIRDLEENEYMRYNKISLKNPGFIVAG